MTDLDRMLDAMRTAPADARLADLDDAVMQGVTAHRDRTAARRSVMLAGLVAIGVGWAGSVFPAPSAQAAPVTIGMSDYAPSRLLGQ